MFQKRGIGLVDRVLVTGGAGFISSHLVNGLMSGGFDVVVLDDLSSGRRENLGVHFGRSNFCLVEGDVRDEADVKKALEGVDVVFHLAAIVSVDFSVKNPLLVNEVNVGGTLNVFRVASCPDIFALPVVLRRRRYVLEYRSPWSLQVKQEFGGSSPLVKLSAIVESIALKYAEVITLTISKLVISRCAHFTRAIKESLGIRSLLTLFSYNSVPKSLV